MQNMIAISKGACQFKTHKPLPFQKPLHAICRSRKQSEQVIRGHAAKFV